MASTGLKIQGVRAVFGKLTEVGERGRRACEAGIYLVGSDVMTDSKRRTPVDKGPLRNSGYVTLPERRGKRSVTEIGYGGAAEDYAVVQHEDLSLNHEVGEAKFLERAIQAQGASIVQRLLAYARSAFAANAGPVRGSLPTAPTGGA